MKILFSFIFLVLSFFVNAEKIDAYNIDIEVKQSGKLHITETIDYNFGNQKRHGIFREIPIKYSLNRLYSKNLGFQDFSVSMDNRSVNYKISKIKEILGIKIGSENILISGSHRYIISYIVNKGVLPNKAIKGTDAIRWNFTGDKWRVPINNISVNIFLPKSLSKDNANIRTYTGRYKSTTTAAVVKWVNKRHIYITVPYLQTRRSATFNLAYPKKTLDQTGLADFKLNIPLEIIVILMILALCAISFFPAYKKYTLLIKSKPIVVQYYPPENFSILQSNLFLENSSDSVVFNAAILELSYLKYIKIEKVDGKVILKKTNKEMNGLTENQRLILEKILFEKDNIFELSSEPINSFISKIKLIKSRLSFWFDFTYKSNNETTINSLKKIRNILIMVFSILYFAISMQTYQLIYLILIFMLSSISIVIICFIFRYIAAILVTIFIIIYSFYSTSFILVSPLVGTLITISLYDYIVSIIPTYIDKGVDIHRHLLGLDEFIRKVKKDEIEVLLRKDPLYLEKLLPYSILFNQVSFWCDFFELMNVKSEWYTNRDDISSLAVNLHTMMTPRTEYRESLNSSSNSRDSSSSSSNSSSGGGFSGGGGGGGGGGSW